MRDVGNISSRVISVTGILYSCSFTHSLDTPDNEVEGSYVYFVIIRLPYERMPYKTPLSSNFAP